MSRPLRLWALCAGAAALVAVAAGLTAYARATPAPRRAAASAAPSRLTSRTATPTPVATPAPIPRNKPVALVAGQPISGAAYADLVARERVAAAAQAQQQGGSAPDERQIRTQALTDIITTAVINHYARQHGITATARAVQQRYDATKTQIEQQARQAGQSVTFTAVLKQYGYTVASFKQAIADAIVGSKVEQKIAPPGLIDAVRVRHILIGPPLTQSGAGTPTPTAKAKPDSYYKAEAETVYQQLKHDPSRFATLARQKSVDTASGAQGGELGWVVKGMTVPAFEKTAFSLPVGQISPPVKSQYGYHIIQVEAHRKVPFTALPQSALQVPAVQALAQRQQNRFQNWLAAERKRDHVRILYKV